MKKKGGIIIIIIALCVVAFAFLSSDTGSEFMSGYGVNFKNNVNSIFKKLNITLPESWQKFLDDVPKEEQPETEYDRLKQEYEKQQKEEEENADKQTEIDNNEYNSTNISHTGKNIAMENASAGRYARYGGGILCAAETSLTFYSQNGERKWSVPIQISSPVLRVSGDFILLFEKSGQKFSVYNGQKNLYTKSTVGKISTGAISADGDASFVFERGDYKGSVSVYNKSGKEVYLWNSGTYRVMDADMSASRRLAVALLDAEGSPSSKIYFFDISKSDPDASIDIADSLVFDIAFDGDVLNAFADNKIMGISANAKEKWAYSTEGKNTMAYSMSAGGTKVVVFDNNNSSEITLVSGNGAEKGIIKSEVLPDFADVFDGRILYNMGRTLVLTNLSGETISKYMCSRDIKRAYIINSDNIFIVYNSSIEFLDMKGK